MIEKATWRFIGQIGNEDDPIDINDVEYVIENMYDDNKKVEKGHLWKVVIKNGIDCDGKDIICTVIYGWTGSRWVGLPI